MIVDIESLSEGDEESINFLPSTRAPGLVDTVKNRLKLPNMRPYFSNEPTMRVPEIQSTDGIREIGFM